MSNLAFRVGKQMGLSEETCHELAVAGVLHDIGKLRLYNYIAGEENPMVVVEVMKYVRRHPELGYERSEGQGLPGLFWTAFTIIMRIMTEAIYRKIWRGKRYHQVKEDPENL